MQKQRISKRIHLRNRGEIEEPAPATTEDFAKPRACPEHKDIALLAYSYWQMRGRPDGSPEEDWFRAERELRSLGR